jgi:hypothetical protein
VAFYAALILVTGCGDPLRTAFSLGVTARKAADVACKPVVAVCVAKKDRACEPLKQCQAKRDAVYPLLERYQSGVAGLVEARAALEKMGVKP